MKNRLHRGQMANYPNEEQIRQEAHRLWQQEGCPVGRDLDHWLTAREILRHRLHEAAQRRKLHQEDKELLPID